MRSSPLKVLHQIRDVVAAPVAALPGVELIAVPRTGSVGDGVDGEVLLTYPWGSPNLEQVLTRGIRWIHVLGTGIDAFPRHVLYGQTLTCSRGASAIPISEWVLAMMLSF